MQTSEFIANDFIRQIISKSSKISQVVTRFPPEPNGYLHIGHAKSICLNFDVAAENEGRCYLRFDDTNPSKEDLEYVESIKNDVTWLGYKWTQLYHSSDYFDQLYEYAVQLIKLDKAYIC
ncbi:MAG: glutamine--tRNA ligase, partial [Candidatus Marithrix sp.]|nr:glutamine--tRNA ligase [Candidatus Marithrix sp.]